MTLVDVERLRDIAEVERHCPIGQPIPHPVIGDADHVPIGRRYRITLVAFGSENDRPELIDPCVGVRRARIPATL